MAIIQAADYNSLQSSVASVLGTGSGDFGYGQSVSSSQVSVGQAISAAHWINLRNDLLKTRQHQTGSDESANLLPVPVAGGIVSQTLYNNCSAMTTLVVSNRLTAASSQTALEELVTATRTSSWNGTLTHTVQVSWASADAARAFFNAGGNIQFSASRSGGSSYSKNNTWTTMLDSVVGPGHSGMGIITFGWDSTTATGSGNITGSSYGWSNLPGSTTEIFRMAAPSGAYSANDYYIYASKTSTTVDFTIRFQDDAGPNPNFDEDVTGTLTSTVQTLRASGSNVSLPQPSYSSSGL